MIKDMADLEKAFKKVYKSWEAWARTGDPEATRQELINGLLAVIEPLVANPTKSSIKDKEVI